MRSHLEKPAILISGSKTRNAAVRSIAFGPDSKTMVATCDDGSVWVYNVRWEEGEMDMNEEDSADEETAWTTARSTFLKKIVNLQQTRF